MKQVLLVGGGSGGHITPNLVVAAELKLRFPGIKINYVAQVGENLDDLIVKSDNIDNFYNIRAGKYRRYHGSGVLQTLNIGTLLRNARDVIYVIIGFFQAYRLLVKIKPQVIFIKGGFVGVPVGLAAAVLHIPYLTHDSDAIPGLANRIIGQWASVHAVANASSLKFYKDGRGVVSGMIVSPNFSNVTQVKRDQYRDELSIAQNAFVILVTGGGLGAVRLNSAVAFISKDLFKDNKLVLIHLCGKGNSEKLEKQYGIVPKGQLFIKEFVSDMYRYSSIADLIITRAGWSALAEFAAQSKPCIVVPNPMLTGGHQTKNAALLEKQKAILVVSEPGDGDTRQLADNLLITINKLRHNQQARHMLARNLQSSISTDGASKIVDLIGAKYV